MDTEAQAKEKMQWEEIKKQARVLHAFRGVRIFFAATRHLYFHIAAALGAVLLGLYVDLVPLEWVAIVFAIGLVFCAECFNTAIEIDIDLTSPEYHPYARDTKDVAAGTVLIAGFISLIVGCIIFIPKFL